MPHSKGLSSIPYPEPNHPIPRIDTYFLRSILILFSHQRLCLLKDFFPVGLSVQILKSLLPSSILTTRPAHLSLLALIILTILDER